MHTTGSSDGYRGAPLQGAGSGLVLVDVDVSGLMPGRRVERSADGAHSPWLARTDARSAVSRHGGPLPAREAGVLP